MDEITTLQAAELEQIRANINQMMANTMKISAETTKIIDEQRYYPMIALSALGVSALGAVAAIIAGIIKLFF
jgi:hypothetical protein